MQESRLGRIVTLRKKPVLEIRQRASFEKYFHTEGSEQPSSSRASLAPFVDQDDLRRVYGQLGKSSLDSVTETQSASRKIKDNIAAESAAR